MQLCPPNLKNILSKPDVFNKWKPLPNLQTYKYVHIYIHMYIPWIHRFFPKTVQCGTNHKYTNTYIVQCKML